MKKLLLFAIILMIPVFYSCSIIPPIATATETFTYEIDDLDSSDDNINSRLINLFENEDYVDNVDRIVSVDQISITGSIDNYGSSSIGFLLFADADTAAEYTTFYELETYATQIFEGPGLILPGSNSGDIDWQTGDDLIMDPTFMADLIINEGVFKIYAYAEPPPFVVGADLTLVITVSVEL